MRNHLRISLGIMTLLLASGFLLNGGAQQFPVPKSPQLSCNAVTATGQCAWVVWPQVISNFRWEVIIAGTGSLSAVSVNLCGSTDGATCIVDDVSTATGGEGRSVVNKPSRASSCNVTTYTVATGTPTVSCRILPQAPQGN